MDESDEFFKSNKISNFHHILAIVTKSFVIIFVILAIYLQDLIIIFTGALNDEANFHIFAIPLLFTYLLFRKRKMIKASFKQTEDEKATTLSSLPLLIGISLLVFSILFYAYGSYSFTPIEFHMFTFPLMIGSLVLILFGFQILKELAFSIFFLIFLMPPPSDILYGVGSLLSNLSSIISTSLANFFTVPAILTSSNIGPLISIIRPDATIISFNVSVGCSGIYSLIGFVIFSFIIAYITIGKIQKKLCVFLIGVPIIILLNIIRITIILIIGYHYGEQLALQVFHTIGSTVLMFIGVLILLTITEKLFKKIPEKHAQFFCSNHSKNTPEHFCLNCGKLLIYPKIKLNKSDFKKIFGLIIITFLLITIQVPVFTLTQGPAKVIDQTPLGFEINNDTSLLPEIQNYTLRYNYRDTSFETATGNDAALTYTYTPNDVTMPTVWVAVQIGKSAISQHRWETCLIDYQIGQGYTPKVNQLELKDIKLIDNPPLIARYFLFQYTTTNQLQAVLYWYQTAQFFINGTNQAKSVMISLVIYPDSVTEIDESEEIQLLIAKAITNYWQPIKNWSSLSLVISQNGFTLSLVAIIVFIVIIIYTLHLKKREKASLFTLYQKLSSQDKLLLKVVDNLNNASTQKVAVEFQKLFNFEVSTDFVLSRLKEAEKHELVKNTLINIMDNPVLIWRNKLSKRI